MRNATTGMLLLEYKRYTELARCQKSETVNNLVPMLYGRAWSFSIKCRQESLQSNHANTCPIPTSCFPASWHVLARGFSTTVSSLVRSPSCTALCQIPGKHDESVSAETEDVCEAQGHIPGRQRGSPSQSYVEGRPPFPSEPS